MLETEESLRGVERTIYNAYFGLAPECKEARKAVRVFFKALNEDGHKTSIRSLVEDLAETGRAAKEFIEPFTCLNDVHPKAWDVILTYGRDYEPLSLWKRGMHRDQRQPKSKSCFLNAYEQMKGVHLVQPSSKVTYVEGFAVGPAVSPMLHAWNGAGFSRRALDWSFYATTHWTRYFGIPFTLAEYEQICERVNPQKPMIQMLFRKDKFEKTEEFILEVLQKSRKRFYHK